MLPCWGMVIRGAELRTSAAGKPWLSVIVRSGDGDAASFVQVAIFGNAVVALGRIEKNEKLYAEGSIRINEWTTAVGERRSGLSMAAWRAERPGVGRNRAKRSTSERTGMPYGIVGNGGRGCQTVSGHSSGVYRLQTESLRAQRYPQPGQEPEFFSGDADRFSTVMDRPKR
jgi:single-stranded DNA-binding protein